MGDDSDGRHYMGHARGGSAEAQGRSGHGLDVDGDRGLVAQGQDELEEFAMQIWRMTVRNTRREVMWAVLALPSLAIRDMALRRQTLQATAEPPQ